MYITCLFKVYGYVRVPDDIVELFGLSDVPPIILKSLQISLQSGIGPEANSSPVVITQLAGCDITPQTAVTAYIVLAVLCRLHVHVSVFSLPLAPDKPYILVRNS